MDAPDVAGLATLEQVFRFKGVCRLATLSSMLLLVYDYVITLPDEVNLVWNSPRSSAKTIFFLNRYFSLFVVITYTCRRTAFDFQAWSNWVACILVELLLQFWVCSVYQPSTSSLCPSSKHYIENKSGKRTRVLMTILCIALATSSAAALGVVLHKVDIEVEMPGCSLAAARSAPLVMKILQSASQPRVPAPMFACMLPSVVYELALLALLVRRELQFLRTGRSCEVRRNPVAIVLIRDSVTYFIIILIAYLANALVWTFAPSQLFQVCVGFGVALPSLLGSRLLLNLRGAHQVACRFTPTVSLSQTTIWDHMLASSAAS
ncbi:hypothetical protein M0805_009774 [Coniferiporia weirii]|nr:hypothetical protein M0805_009774 [Coniferiporia weirii]